jgi:NAD(P)-dependent dehydrogenase (short-subunit alcohol dehydrogenase family)
MDSGMFDMSGKVALITGGRTGIGRAFALAFAQAGADVAICSRSNKNNELNKVAGEIEQLGRRSLAIQADVSIKSNVTTMVEETCQKLGGIDILINNAGISPMGFLLDTEEDIWDRTMDINLKGSYLCSQAVGSIMVKHKKGIIINISSTAGLKPWANATAYSVSKAGTAALTRTLAKELGDYGIRVNAIAPGIVPTEMTEDMLSDPEYKKETIAMRLLKRLGSTDDIANAALFLASDAASWITGQILIVDGGYLA